MSTSGSGDGLGEGEGEGEVDGPGADPEFVRLVDVCDWVWLSVFEQPVPAAPRPITTNAARSWRKVVDALLSIEGAALIVMV